MCPMDSYIILLHQVYSNRFCNQTGEIQSHKFLKNSCGTWSGGDTTRDQLFDVSTNHTKPSCSVKSNNSQLVKNAGLAVYSSIGKSKSGVSRKFVQPHRSSIIKNSPLVSPLTIWIICYISPSSKFLNHDRFPNKQNPTKKATTTWGIGPSVSFIQTSIFDAKNIELWLKIWAPNWKEPQYRGDIFSLDRNRFLGLKNLSHILCSTDIMYSKI